MYDSLKPKKQRCNAKNHFQTSPVSYLFDNTEKRMNSSMVKYFLFLNLQNANWMMSTCEFAIITMPIYNVQYTAWG